MELRHLRYFVIAAEVENLHRAAERLHIAQSALSRQIKDLEDEVGVKLFERHRKRIRLSEAGKAYFAQASRILQEIDHANDLARRIAQGHGGKLRISVHSASLRNPRIPQALHAFRTAYPDIELQLSHLHSASQLDAIQSGRVDAGFNLYEHSDEDADLRHMEIGEDHFVLALPSFHPLAEKPVLQLADLIDEPFLWIQRSVNQGMHDRLLSECVSAGLSPRIVQYVLTQEISPDLVSVGMGISFVLASAREHKSNVAFREVADLRVRLKVGLMWRKETRSPALERFIETVRNTIAPHSSPNRAPVIEMSPPADRRR